MKRVLKTIVSLSSIGALSIFGFAWFSRGEALSSTPLCAVPPIADDSAQPTPQDDERVYYVGCGGLF